MKITETQLRRIIREEKARLLREQMSEDPSITANKLLDETMTFLENKLYGQSCIDAADTEKKSKFLQQLETLEGNQLTDEELQGGSLGGTNEYGDIFGDPNLFNEYGFGD